MGEAGTCSPLTSSNASRSSSGETVPGEGGKEAFEEAIDLETIFFSFSGEGKVIGSG